MLLRVFSEEPVSAHLRVCLSLSIAVNVSTFQQLVCSASCMTSFNHPILSHWLWLLCLICYFLRIQDKAKSNWCNKSSKVNAVGVVPHFSLAVSNEQTVVQRAPICQVCEDRVGTASRVFTKNPRGEHSAVLSSPVSQNVEMMRQWEVVYHTITVSKSLLFCFILIPSHLTTSPPRKKNCLYLLLLLYVLHLSLPSSSSLFSAVGAANTLVYASTFAFNTTFSGLWLDYLHFSLNERQCFSLLCQQSTSCFHRHWLLLLSRTNSAVQPIVLF